MGRPLNKRNFGASGTGPTAGGSEIKVNFHNGTAVKEGFIVKQLSSKRFRCEEIGHTAALPLRLTHGGRDVVAQIAHGISSDEFACSIASCVAMNIKHGGRRTICGHKVA